MNRLRRSLALALGAGVVVAVLGEHVRLDTSASLPRGLYLLERRAPARADLILFCPPRRAAELAAARRYLPAGRCPAGVASMGKLLVAAPGDVLELAPSGMAINGRGLEGSRPRSADSDGRPLAHYPYGRYAVAGAQLWVYSPHPRSYDSRYFGPVPAAQFLGTLRPLWTSSQSPMEHAAERVRHSPPAVR